MNFAYAMVKVYHKENNNKDKNNLHMHTAIFHYQCLDLIYLLNPTDNHDRPHHSERR